MATIETMFKLQTSLCITLIVSIIGSLLCIALLFGIILFERNQHYRTLINQLVTSMYWYGILWILTLQIPTIIRYIVGPFPEVFCAVDIIYRNVFNMQVLFFLDFIILSRYIFIFYLKNPTALQEDFWKIFINAFTITFSVISQIVNFLLPGKNPNIYYVCLGYFPEKLIKFPTKANLPVTYQFLITFFLYLFASTRIKIHRKKQRANDLVQTASVPIHQGVINFQTLENFTTNVIHLFVMLVSFSATVMVNKISIDKFEIFENYFFVYIQHHFLPIFMLGTMMLINYAKNKQLRNFFMVEFISDVKDIFGI